MLNIRRINQRKEILIQICTTISTRSDLNSIIKTQKIWGALNYDRIFNTTVFDMVQEAIIINGWHTAKQNIGDIM
jgi:hypothetical protein